MMMMIDRTNEPLADKSATSNKRIEQHKIYPSVTRFTPPKECKKYENKGICQD